MVFMNAAAGYPFMVQLVGCCTWQSAVLRSPEGGAICMEEAERTGKSATEVSAYRKRLIDAGPIESPRNGRRDTKRYFFSH